MIEARCVYKLRLNATEPRAIEPKTGVPAMCGNQFTERKRTNKVARLGGCAARSKTDINEIERVDLAVDAAKFSPMGP